jgi:hypothetical protein
VDEAQVNRVCQGSQRAECYRRTLVLALCASWGAALPAQGAQETRSAPRSEEIAAALQQQWGRVESLAVEYTLKAEALDRPEVLRRYLALAYLPEEKVAFAFKGRKRYCRVEYDRTLPRLAPDTEPDYDIILGGKEMREQDHLRREQLIKLYGEEKAREMLRAPLRPGLNWELGFDGDTLRRKNPGKRADIQVSTSLDEDDRWLVQDYMTRVFHTLPDAVNPANDRRSVRLADVLSDGKFSVRPDLEEVDGAPCLILTGPTKLWLDPKLGFAMRKLEALVIGKDVLYDRTHNHDFVEALPGFWLPKTIWWERCGPSEAPAPYRGKPLLRYVYSVNSLRVNDVPDSLFRLEIEPGWEVIDTTRLPPKDGKPQAIHYTMPADASQLEVAIQQAMAEVKPEEAWNWLRPALGLTVVGLSIILLGLAIKFGRRSRGTSPSRGAP